MSTNVPRDLRAALLACVFCASCNGTTSYLDATGTAGHEEAVLGTWLTGVACAVVALVCIAIFAAMARHRDTSAEPTERREIRSGLSWIYVGISATILVLLATFAGTMVTLNAATHPSKVPSLTMDVTGHQWWWD